MSDALFEAVMQGNVEDVLALLEAGDSVNECNEDGQTPLAIAALKDDLAMVDLLLANGADPNHGSDLDEMDARIRCVEAALSPAQDGLRDTPPCPMDLMDTPPCSGSTPLFHAAFAGSNRVALRLIASGTDVNRVNDDLETALLYAVMGGNAETVELLLRHGAKIDGNFLSPFSGAVDMGREDMVSLMLRNGADPNRFEHSAVSVLEIAARYGHSGVVRQLLHAGANPAHVDDHGRTALMHAAEGGYLEIVNLLLAAGADLRVTDPEGKTALEIAQEAGHERVVEALMAAGAVG